MTEATAAKLDAPITLIPGFLGPETADQSFATLLAELPWERRTTEMYGKDVPVRAWKYGLPTIPTHIRAERINLLRGRQRWSRLRRTSKRPSAPNSILSCSIATRAGAIPWGTVFWHSGIPFSVLSTPYSANSNGIVNGSGPQFASVIPGVPLYEHKPIPGVTQPGTIQWLNPNAFVSSVDPSTGACNGGDAPENCQFGNLGRNALRGPDFTWSDLCLTKWFPLSEKVRLRFDVQFFNVFNHPNFGLPTMVLAGIPGKPSTQTGFGGLTYTTSPPTGLLGVGLGGDSTPRMIAFQLRLEF